jgi:hypothetical protein
MPTNAKTGQPEYPISLAKTPAELDMPMPVGEKASEPIYPSLFLSWEKPYNFPDEGTMTVKFKKRSEENRKRGDKTTQNVELDILEITDTTATESSEEKEESAGDVLDKAVAKKAKKNKKAAVVVVEDEEAY